MRRSSGVLVVEDEILIALDLEATFTDAGAEVIGPCATLSRALEFAERELLSAATLDVRVGQETTEAVAALLFDRGIPFLFYSGQALPKCIQTRRPDCNVIAKPANQESLVQAVAALLKPSHNA